MITLYLNLAIPIPILNTSRVIMSDFNEKELKDKLQKIKDEFQDTEFHFTCNRMYEL